MPKSKPTFTDGGALFNNTRKTSSNAPTLVGNLTISREVLDYLNEQSRKGEELKVDMSAWKKTSQKNNQQYYSLSARVPWNKQKPEGDVKENTFNDDFDDEIPF